MKAETYVLLVGLGLGGYPKQERNSKVFKQETKSVF